MELVSLDCSRFLMTNLIRDWDTVAHFAELYAHSSNVPFPVVTPTDDSSENVLVIGGHHRLVAQASCSESLSAIIIYHDNDLYSLYSLIDSGRVVRGAPNFESFLSGYNDLRFLKIKAFDAHRSYTPGKGYGFTLQTYFDYLRSRP